jgi:hypothetical protein
MKPGHRTKFVGQAITASDLVADQVVHVSMRSLRALNQVRGTLVKVNQQKIDVQMKIQWPSQRWF